MKAKVIKLTQEHYVIVDDSELQVGDWYLNTYVNEKELKPQKHTEKRHLINHKKDYRFKYCKKITHSTQPLEDVITENSFKSYKFIPLEEIEELIYGYNLEKLAIREAKKLHSFEKHSDTDIYNQCVNEDAELIIIGFKAHQELVKDKMFTIEDMREAFFDMKHPHDEIDFQHLLIRRGYKTEWDIEIDENGKITLL